MAEVDYEAAHRHSFRNREEVTASEVCGCFHCQAIFSPGEIVQWVDESDGRGETALCPHCCIDAVIGSVSGYRIDAGFLSAMYERFFC